MRESGVSPWDQLRVIYPGCVGVVSDPAFRCKLRTAPFEEALELLEPSGLQEADAWRLVSLGNDLSRRRLRWTPPEAEPAPIVAVVQRSPIRRVWIPTIGAVLSITLLLMGAWGSSTRLSLAGAVLLLCAGAAAVYFVFRRPRERLQESATSHECPTCRYDLRGLPPAIPTEYLRGLDAGPRACPECGTLWPLVPPGDYPEVALRGGP